MNIRKRRVGATPPIEQVAGNGLLDRRALLARRRHGGRRDDAPAPRSPARPPSRSRTIRGAWRWARPCRPIRWPSRFEKNVVRTLQQSEQRVPQLACAHAASSAAGHGHAQRPVLHHHAFRPAGHRSGPAQARHPRAGEAAAGLHGRVAVALSDGDAHAFPRVQRQLGADVLQRAAAGDRPGAARPRFECRMDRRAAVDAAGGDRHRPEGEVAARRRRRLARRSIAACRSRRRWTTP